MTQPQSEPGRRPLRASEHFIPLERLPQIDVGTLLRAVFAEVSVRAVGGFIATRSGRAGHYLQAPALAAVLGGEVQARRMTWRGVAETALGEVIPLAQSHGAAIALEGGAVTDDTDLVPLQQRGDAVYAVQAAGQLAGWFLNHETLVRTVNTPPPVFWCARPRDPHPNPDPDHGRCYRCPAPIVGPVNPTPGASGGGPGGGAP